jgi:hypothetical protein
MKHNRQSNFAKKKEHPPQQSNFAKKKEHPLQQSVI